MFKSSMFLPNNKLSNWIKVYWFLEGRGLGNNFNRQYILPDGCATIVFVLKGEMVLETYDNGLLTEGIYIIPPTLDAHYDLISDDIFLVDIQLIPGMFHQLFNIPIEELENRIYSFDDISIDFETSILEKLLKLKNSKSLLVDEINSFFTQLFYTKDFIPNKLLFSIEELYRNGNLEHFYERQTLSKRQIQRKVKCITGLNPKMISRIGRFYKILDSFNYKNVELDFVDIALSNNYADQSHFIKDFKSFTRASPKQFMRQHNQYLQYKAIAENNLIS